MADDLGWSDTGFAGSRFYETPHLDALAAGGMRFTSFYTAPNGVPTRASVLTGQYAARTGILTSPHSDEHGGQRELMPPSSRGSLPRGVVTIARLLKNCGYATAFFGRWKLGTEGEDHPSRHGFDETLLTAGKHFGFETDPPIEVPEETYVADFVTDRAIEFIERRHKAGPFFVQLSHMAVHPPYEAKPGWVSRFARKPPAGGHRDAVYAAMIASLDENVGRLLARLEELSLAADTAVFFLSDNGGEGGFAVPGGGSRRVGITDNAPLRGGKGTLYEGGIRVPMLVRWPGVTQPGSRTAQPAHCVDLFPTLAQLAGARLPEDHPIDGTSLVPLLRNPNAHLGRDAIYWHFPVYVSGSEGALRSSPAGAIRAGNFKLIESFEDNRLELYNLVEDLGERNNLVRSLPDKAAELRAKLAAWRRALNAPMPVRQEGGASTSAGESPAGP